jgi:hypothetical protein
VSGRETQNGNSREPILAAMVTKKKLRVVGATYDLAIEECRESKRID